MYPILFNLGPLTVRSYGLFLVLAFVLATYVVWKEGKRGGYNEEKLLDFSVITLIATLLGGRLYYALINPQSFIDDPIRVLYFWQGGFAFHGALLGGVLGGWYFIKKNKWPIWQIADLGAIAAAIAMAVAKIGAFLAGSDYGTVTTLPWGLNFIGQVGKRHPTQLYEAVFYLALFFVLKKIDQQKKRSGGIFFLYILLVGISRWVFEFFRGDSTFIGDVKVAQVVSLLLVVIGLVGLYYFSRRDWKTDLRVLIVKLENVNLPFANKKKK